MPGILEEIFRCEVTGNLCGTDTWPKGSGCGCHSCVRWLIFQVESLHQQLAAKDAIIENLTARNRELVMEDSRKQGWLDHFNEQHKERAAGITQAERAEQARLINERDAAKEEVERLKVELTSLREVARAAEDVRTHQRGDCFCNAGYPHSEMMQAQDYLDQTLSSHKSKYGEGGE